MTTSPRFGFTLLASAQAAPETQVNENDLIIEAGAGHLIFKDRDLNTPPGSPSIGDMYHVGASPTGAWAGEAGNIALYITSWRFASPIEGLTAWVNDEDVFIGYDGATWSTLAAPSGTYQPLDATLQSAEWAPNFTADGDVYIPAVEAMTIDEGNAAIGTGALAYEKSTTAAPGTFSSTTLPATLQAGAWLKVSASSVTGFVAAHLVRTA